MHRSARHSIARTTLAFDRTALAIRPLRSIAVAHLQVPLFFALVFQDLSLRTAITVSLRIIDKRRTMILWTHPAPFIGTLSFARLIHTGRDKLNFPPLHRHYIVPADKPSISHHLFRRLAQVLLHSLHPRLQLLKVIARLHHSHRYHHTFLRIRVDLDVIARCKATVGLLHHPCLGITRAHPSLLFVLTFFRQLVKFLQRLLQPLLALSGRSLARLGHAPARFLFAHRSHRCHLLSGLLERLLHSVLSPKTIGCRVGSDLGPVLHHSFQCNQSIGAQ